MSRPALVLVDLQLDFLRTLRFAPASTFVARVAALLGDCRARGVPVLHVRTTVRRDDDRRMAHWRAAGRWDCEAGTPGHAAPPELALRADEPVIDKTAFSAFVENGLAEALAARGADTLWIAGLHTHACVRATALDAYQRGLAVTIVEDAVASDDPWHAAATLRYLRTRGIAVVPTARLGESPAPAPDVAPACAAAREAARAWRAAGTAGRAAVLARLAQLVRDEAEPLAAAIVAEVRKPVRYARGEVARSIALVEAALRQAAAPLEAPCGPRSSARRRPLGVVAQVTPWNNPLAIPVGKLVPALAFGNAVAWSPSAHAVRVAELLGALFERAGAPPGLVAHAGAGPDAARELVTYGDVDAVAFTGSILAGCAVQEACARRHLPLQAELGGNNAAIVRPDADHAAAAAKIAEGAFGFAGQRCTANRRVIVEGAAAGPFLDALREAVEALPCGDPHADATIVPPLITAAKAREVARLADGAPVLARGGTYDDPAYHAPLVLDAPDAAHELVQHETFGPLLVVQRARDFDEALALCNGVAQGLAAALFTPSAAHRARFLDEARAGILKLDEATADADTEAPFGGWKASGVGPPEHGAANREFYTRAQAVYAGEDGA